MNEKQSCFRLVNFAVFAICILMTTAFLLPQIARQRSLARSQQCMNNLKQLGLAIHNYHSAYKQLPPGSGGTTGGEDHQSNQGRLGFLVGLTPFVEQQSLWEKISQPYRSAKGTEFPPMGPAPWYDANEYEPWAASGEVFRCPSTPHKKPDDRPKIVYTLKSPENNAVGVMTNFVACFGDGTHMVGQQSPGNDAPIYNAWLRQSRASNRGMFVSSSRMKFRDVLDGLSFTIMASETQSSVLGKPGLSGIAKDIAGLSENPSLCLGVVKDPDVKWWKSGRGSRWCDGALAITGFQTVLPPNSPTCSSELGIDDTVASASSYHLDGVLVLMGDGAVKYVSNTIDCGDSTAAGVNLNGEGASVPGSKSPYGVWGAMGSRASRERFELPNDPVPHDGASIGIGSLVKGRERPTFTWTDHTGEIKLSAKFLKIVDKKSVQLEDNLGTIHQVPLNTLSDRDIYRAVAMELDVQPIQKKNSRNSSRMRSNRSNARAVEEYERMMMEEVKAMRAK